MTPGTKAGNEPAEETAASKKPGWKRVMIVEDEEPQGLYISRVSCLYLVFVSRISRISCGFWLEGSRSISQNTFKIQKFEIFVTYFSVSYSTLQSKIHFEPATQRKLI